MRHGGSQNKLLVSGGPRGLGLNSVVYIFVFFGNIIFCQLFKLALSDPAQVTQQLRVILSDLV
jgi:hypothetical protein